MHPAWRTQAVFSSPSQLAPASALDGGALGAGGVLDALGSVTVPGSGCPDLVQAITASETPTKDAHARMSGGLAWMDMTTAHLILYVRDQRASTEFYRRALGVEPRLDVPGMTELEIGGAVLGLMPESGIRRLLPGLPDPAAGHGIPRAELYLVVDDPAARHAAALAAGARELSPLAPRDWGHDAAYALDPDGHVLAFARPR